jgi:hypothetical protein
VRALPATPPKMAVNGTAPPQRTGAPPGPAAAGAAVPGRPPPQGGLGMLVEHNSYPYLGRGEVWPSAWQHGGSEVGLLGQQDRALLCSLPMTAAGVNADDCPSTATCICSRAALILCCALHQLIAGVPAGAPGVPLRGPPGPPGALNRPSTTPGVGVPAAGLQQAPMGPPMARRPAPAPPPGR